MAKRMAEPGDMFDQPVTAGRLVCRGAWLYDPAMTWCAFGQHRRINRAVAACLAAKPGERVLDVGCATGQLTQEVARTLQGSGEAVGVDASAPMIRIARRNRGGSCRFDLAAAEQLPFPDACFDATCSSLMYHHLNADLKRRSLAEICRVLKPGGRIVIADMGPPCNILGALLSYPSWLLLRQPEIRENMLGLLPRLISEAGFAGLAEEARLLGCIYVYSARKPV